jgi:AcrR family transcriptional regulator
MANFHCRLREMEYDYTIIIHQNDVKADNERPVWRARRQRSRAERVQATCELVLVHASVLFVERGYMQTTMADIASAAGVAVQTLYLRFAGKPAILAAAFDRAVAGDAKEVAITDREWVEELRAAADFPEAARLLVHNARLIVERATPLFTRIEQASADPEIADVLVESKRRKYETVGDLAQILRGKPGFDRDVPLDKATDVLYALSSEDLFRLLCFERGWTSGEWESFVMTAITREFASGEGSCN